MSLGGRTEQSSTMPRAPPRASRQQRRASDASLDADAAQHDDSSYNSHKETPLKAGVDRPTSVSNNIVRSEESERSLRAPVGLGLKAFTSPVAVAATASPSNTGVLAPTNTRRIGSKFCIDLVKGWFDVDTVLLVTWPNLVVVVSDVLIMIKR